MAPGCDARAYEGTRGGRGILNTVDPTGRSELSYLEFIRRYYSSTARSVYENRTKQSWPLQTLVTRFF